MNADPDQQPWSGEKNPVTSSEAEVAGEGVAVGVQGEGGPGVPPPFPTTANFHSGLSLITWVASFPRNSSRH